MCKDLALQEVPGSVYQARYLVSVVVEHHLLKTFSECSGPAGGESASETYKTCKGLKPEYTLLLCTQETTSQNPPYFLLKHKRLCLGKESVSLQWTLKFSFKMMGKQTSLLAKLKCSMHHLTIY